jgi:hypothetical protein
MQPIAAYMLQKIQAAKCLAVSVCVLLQPPTCLLYIPPRTNYIRQLYLGCYPLPARCLQQLG